jgi:hypothetical protein
MHVEIWHYVVLIGLGVPLWLSCGLIARRISIGLTTTRPSALGQAADVMMGPIGIIAYSLFPKRPW